jgi:hypothetical protein
LTEPRKPPNVSMGQALLAIAVLCVFCLVIGFVLGRTV